MKRKKLEKARHEPPALESALEREMKAIERAILNERKPEEAALAIDRLEARHVSSPEFAPHVARIMVRALDSSHAPLCLKAATFLSEFKEGEAREVAVKGLMSKYEKIFKFLPKKEVQGKLGTHTAQVIRLSRYLLKSLGFLKAEEARPLFFKALTRRALLTGALYGLSRSNDPRAEKAALMALRRSQGELPYFERGNPGNPLRLLEVYKAASAVLGKVAWQKAEGKPEIKAKLELLSSPTTYLYEFPKKNLLLYAVATQPRLRAQLPEYASEKTAKGKFLQNLEHDLDTHNLPDVVDILGIAKRKKGKK